MTTEQIQSLIVGSDGLAPEDFVVKAANGVFKVEKGQRFSLGPKDIRLVELEPEP